MKCQHENSHESLLNFFIWNLSWKCFAFSFQLRVRSNDCPQCMKRNAAQTHTFDKHTFFSLFVASEKCTALCDCTYEWVCWCIQLDSAPLFSHVFHFEVMLLFVICLNTARIPPTRHYECVRATQKKNVLLDALIACFFPLMWIRIFFLLLIICDARTQHLTMKSKSFDLCVEKIKWMFAFLRISLACICLRYWKLRIELTFARHFFLKIT